MGTESPGVGLAKQAARLALSKIGRDVVVLDMSRAVTYTDLFVLITGSTSRQTHAINDAIQRGLREAGVRPTRIEGERAGEWILLDYLDIVVHIFTPQAREFYRLEHLWGEVPRLSVTDANVDRMWTFSGEEDDADDSEVETA